MSTKNAIYEPLTEDSDEPTPSTNYIKKLITQAVPQRDIDCNIDRTVFVLQKPPAKKSKLQKKKPKISRKEKQKLNLLKVPKTGWNYEEFEGLRLMWTQYMTSYLNLDNPNFLKNESCSSIHNLMGRADFHGAEMSVVRSKCPSLIGITGTCILDTKNTFKILSKDNKARIVPKKDCIFKLHINEIEITLYGKYLIIKPGDRSAKKIKTSMVLDL